MFIEINNLLLGSILYSSSKWSSNDIKLIILVAKNNFVARNKNVEFKIDELDNNHVYAAKFFSERYIDAIPFKDRQNLIIDNICKYKNYLDSLEEKHHFNVFNKNVDDVYKLPAIVCRLDGKILYQFKNNFDIDSEIVNLNLDEFTQKFKIDLKKVNEVNFNNEQCDLFEKYIPLRLNRIVKDHNIKDNFLLRNFKNENRKFIISMPLTDLILNKKDEKGKKLQKDFTMGQLITILVMLNVTQNYGGKVSNIDFKNGSYHKIVPFLKELGFNTQKEDLIKLKEENKIILHYVRGKFMLNPEYLHKIKEDIYWDKKIKDSKELFERYALTAEDSSSIINENLLEEKSFSNFILEDI